LKTKQTVTDVI